MRLQTVAQSFLLASIADNARPLESPKARSILVFQASFRSLAAAASFLASTCVFAAVGNQSAQEAFIDSARAAISQCSQVREMDVSAQQQMNAVKIAQRELQASGNENQQIETVDEASLSITEKFPLCRQAVRRALLPRAKSFIGSFKDAAQKRQAQAMVTQWLAAVDAIRSRTADHETENFERLANRLVTEMQ
ncbi:MAG: hypothetical protein JWR16_1088 [Nevskia sp.]|nr:hypothetical protein [Nevskia sp.]